MGFELEPVALGALWVDSVVNKDLKSRKGFLKSLSAVASAAGKENNMSFSELTASV